MKAEEHRRIFGTSLCRTRLCRLRQNSPKFVESTSKAKYHERRTKQECKAFEAAFCRVVLEWSRKKTHLNSPTNCSLNYAMTYDLNKNSVIMKV